MVRRCMLAEEELLLNLLLGNKIQQFLLGILEVFLFSGHPSPVPPPPPYGLPSASCLLISLYLSAQQGGWWL